MKNTQRNAARSKSNRTTTREPFNERVRFNWGFHDATLDRTMSGMTPRTLTETGEHSTAQVSKRFSVGYYHGYAAGLLADLQNGRPQSSEPAWLEFAKTLTPAQRAEWEKDY